MNQNSGLVLNPYQVNNTSYPSPLTPSPSTLVNPYNNLNNPEPAPKEKKKGIPGWIIVVIILVIVIVIVVVGWILYANYRSEKDNGGGGGGSGGGANPDPDPDPDPDSGGDFNDSCQNDSDCNDNLLCSQGRCKKSLGQPCESLDECTSEANVCNGLCSVSQTNILNGACPCISNSLVPVDTDDGCICLGGPGFICERGSDCLSGVCNSAGSFSVCTAPQQRGNPCGGSNGKCDDGLECSFGFCQLIDVETGTVGAYCENNQPFPAEPGQTAPGCQNGTTCFDNACVVTSGDLKDVCFASLPQATSCSGPLVCTSGTCSFPISVNACKNTACSSGFSCNGAGSCLAKKGIGCDRDSNCVSGTCGLGEIPGLFSWNYSNSFINRGFEPLSGSLEYKGEFPLYSIYPVNKTLDSNTSNTTNTNTNSNLRNLEVYALDSENNIWHLPRSTSTAAFTWTKILNSKFTMNIPELNRDGQFDVLGITANYDTGFNLIAFNIVIPNTNKNYNALYRGQLDNNTYNLTPFNTTNNNFPGAQYHDGNILFINQLDVSVSNNSNPDVVLEAFTESDSGIFTKAVSVSSYVLRRSTGRIPRFYKAFTPPTGSPLPDPPPQVENFTFIDTDGLIHFNGQVADLTDDNGNDVVYPTDLSDGTSIIYNVVSYSIWSNPGLEGINDAYLWIVARNISTGEYLLFFVNEGQFQIPGYYNSETNIGANNQIAFLSTDKVCS